MYAKKRRMVVTGTLPCKHISPHGFLPFFGGIVPSHSSPLHR